MNKFISCLLLCFIVACSAEQPPLSGPPVTGVPGSDSARAETGGSSAKDMYVLEIVPKETDRHGTLNAVAHGFSLSQTSLQWLVNGNPLSGSNTAQFPVMQAKKGDMIKAQAIFAGKEIFSDSVKIRNAPPEISRIVILPEVFKPNDTLSVDVSVNDIDDDDITITYEWTKNGESAGNGKQISGMIKRGDTVSVRITPFDGENYGQAAILHREIRNLPPTIMEDKTFTVKGNLYTYQIKAVDPDGDMLLYSLASAPSGMTIDKSTGMIRWNMPVDLQGKISFSVSVSDGNGGEAKQAFVFDVRPEPRQ